MKIILAMVTSVDGKSTKDKLSPRNWASKEDQVYFSKLIKSHQLVIMGNNTYQASKDFIKLNPKILRVIMTGSPKKYAKQTVPGLLQFSNESPKKLVKELSNLGYKKMLLLGGSKLNQTFLKAGLVNELWLTIEPLIFGKGLGLVDGSIETKMKLLSIKRLNKQGTLLLKYSCSYADHSN